MAKYVINADGGTHSVDDDFEVPEGWEVVDEATVRQVLPELLGESRPEPAPVENTSVPGEVVPVVAE